MAQATTIALVQKTGVMKFSGYVENIERKGVADIPPPVSSEKRYARADLGKLESHKIGEGWKGFYYPREGMHFQGTTADLNLGGAELTADSRSQIVGESDVYDKNDTTSLGGYTRPEEIKDDRRISEVRSVELFFA